MRQRERWASMLSCWRAALVVCGLASGGLNASAVAEQPCAVSPQPWITLRVNAGAAFSSVDRTLVVRVHPDGCVELHRPGFYRLPGDFRLQLSERERRALTAQVDAAQLRGFDASVVRTALHRAQSSSARSTREPGHVAGAAEKFVVLDADHVSLEVVDGGRSSTVAWSGLHQDAELFPELLELVALSDSVKAVQALLERTDALRVTSSAP